MLMISMFPPVKKPFKASQSHIKPQNNNKDLLNCTMCGGIRNRSGFNSLQAGISVTNCRNMDIAK